MLVPSPSPSYFSIRSRRSCDPASSAQEYAAGLNIVIIIVVIIIIIILLLLYYSYYYYYYYYDYYIHSAYYSY